MSSSLQPTLELLRLNDYTFLAVMTAVVYDYVLTFSREIDYVWHRPWTWVTMLFFLVRYGGLSWTILNGLIGRTLIPGPVTMCTVIFLVTVWEFLIFLSAADLVMILRVYAMWNRSKKILRVLLFFYVAQIIVSCTLLGIYNNSNAYLSVTVIRLLDVSFCNISRTNIPSLLTTHNCIPRFALSATLLFLAVIQSLKQSVEMYKVTRKWQPNRYMQQLVRDGIIYFLVNALFHINFLAQSKLSDTVSDTSTAFLNLFCYTTICSLIPRFIIGVRELYERDARQGIDNGFGVSLQPISDSEDAAVSMIVFADVGMGQGQVVEEDESM